LGPKLLLKPLCILPLILILTSNDVKDNTHFSTYDAYQLAKCVVNGIKENIPALAKYLKNDPPEYDPSKPDDPAKWHLPASALAVAVKPDGN